jgi:hypothetical protein
VLLSVLYNMSTFVYNVRETLTLLGLGNLFRGAGSMRQYETATFVLWERPHPKMEVRSTPTLFNIDPTTLPPVPTLFICQAFPSAMSK